MRAVFEAFAVLAAIPGGRARATVRKDEGTRNGAWARAKLREIAKSESLATDGGSDSGSSYLDRRDCLQDRVGVLWVNQRQVFKHMFDLLSADRSPFMVEVLEHCNEKFDYETADTANCCCRDNFSPTNVL